MQTLARAGLSRAEVITHLQASGLQVDAGCELLTLDLTVVEDISADLEAASVGWQLDRAIHETCSLRLARELVWGVDLVRLYQTLTVGGVALRFDAGVFCLTTPVTPLGQDLPTWEVSGFNRLYLLDRQVGDDFFIAAGTTYRAALLAVFAAAGLTGILIDGSAADSTLPVDRTWPLVPRSTDPDQTDTPVTWLRIANDLLRAINFRSVWCDELGRYRCQAYAPPSERPIEYVFDAGDEFHTIVGVDRESEQDVWATPNRWVAIASNPPEGVVPDELNGLVQVRENLTDGPTSQAARGLVWPSVLAYEAADAATLAGLVDRRVALDKAVTQRLRLSTGPFPCGGHADIYSLTDAELGGTVRVQAVERELDLFGSDPTHIWEVIA